MGPMLSLRDGDWKLIVGQELITEGKLKHHALFNLKDNPTEDERQKPHHISNNTATSSNRSPKNCWTFTIRGREMGIKKRSAVRVFS